MATEDEKTMITNNAAKWQMKEAGTEKYNEDRAPSMRLKGQKTTYVENEKSLRDVRKRR